MSKISKLIQTLSLDVTEIARRSGVPESRVHAIVDGNAANLDELRALSRGLKLPLRDFAGSPKQDEELSLLFRQGSASRADQGVNSISAFVRAALSILPPKKALDSWISQMRATAFGYADAENLAEQFRNRYFGGLPDPLHNLPELVSSLGGIVLGRLDASRYEGASLVADGYAFIFVSPRFSGRMLFTLAHELGHVLAHHQEARSAIFDLSSQIGSSRYHSPAEKFVDAFASNLLLPRDGVGIALGQIRKSLNVRNPAIGDIEILYLATLYGVSFEVAARRCEQLELLPIGGAVSLSQHVKKKHGSAEKLAQKLNLPPRAQIKYPQVSNNILDAAIRKIERGEVSIGWVTDHFGCSAGDIYSLRMKYGASLANSH
jgi:Zn-dependent peptidase ImmA (M78 family)